MFAAGLAANAGAEGPGDPKLWRLLVEPKFMRPEVSWGIPFARRTVMAAAWVRDGEVVYFTRKEFDALNLDWDSFARQARVNGAPELAELKP